MVDGVVSFDGVSQPDQETFATEEVSTTSLPLSVCRRHATSRG